jgi:DNA polymerase/3'-5' exonuclease PolX
MFEQPNVRAQTELDVIIRELIGAGQLAPGGKQGQRYQEYWAPSGIKVDMFVVLPPAQWGYQFLIRTGPKEFSKWAVTPRRQGGGLPSHMRAGQGAIWQDNEVVEMPEEADFLRLIGMDGVAPQERRARWNGGVR